MAVDIRYLSEKYDDYIIERRRFYHAWPELSGQEKNTREFIKHDLEALGITEITEMKNCYGLTAMIRGGRPGKTIGLRADMDALPIHEETGLSYSSRNEGIMHACGHDSHIAMLLGAAKILQSVKSQLSGNVLLIFQPSEENASGASWMVAEHATDCIDALYGMHIWGELDAPLIDISEGNRMAAADLFYIDVYGASAHGASPNLGIDAISIGCNIVVNLQQCVSRINDPLNPMVVSIGEFRGGPRFNVISDHVEMVGTTRYFKNDIDIENTMRRVIENTAAAMGGRAELRYIYKSPAVINKDPVMNTIARNAVVKLFGEHCIGILKPTMGGEDYPILAQGKPFFFAFLGTHDEEGGYTCVNHQQGYTLDETLLKRGSALTAQFALDYLAQA
ncbi:MAG: amidohydrolase [Oscillospiraceae bacterium]|nr:amidohydrolase [Oscillospiraceae bacterium]